MKMLILATLATLTLSAAGAYAAPQNGFVKDAGDTSPTVPVYIGLDVN